MTNQPINQPNIISNSRVEKSPSRRVYAFKDLPPQTQQNLLRLQNSDGDFLKIGYVAPSTSGALLVFLAIEFILYLADLLEFFDRFNTAVYGLKWSVVLWGGGVIFALSFLYLIWGFVRGLRSPMKRGIYLTHTQLIETFNGIVRYRELKDASEISLDKFQGGWQTSINVRFPDGDLYKYKTFMNYYSSPPAKQIAEAEKWQEKIESWRNEAINAAQRGDTAYFDSRNVIQNSATANLPVVNRFFSPLLMMRVMFVITMAMIGFVTIVFYAIKISNE